MIKTFLGSVIRLRSLNRSTYMLFKEIGGIFENFAKIITQLKSRSENEAIKEFLNFNQKIKSDDFAPTICKFEFLRFV